MTLFGKQGTNPVYGQWTDPNGGSAQIYTKTKIESVTGRNINNVYSLYLTKNNKIKTY